MNLGATQKLLDYCCIMLYDQASFKPHPTDNDSLVELFIRNSLKVKSTKQVKVYFENHLAGKSEIFNFPSKQLRACIRFYNKLKKQNNAYSRMILISRPEENYIQDVRFLQYKVLAFEVENHINGIQSFDNFLSRSLVFQSPVSHSNLTDESSRDIKLNGTQTPTSKIRTNLPTAHPINKLF